jgi:hypothetical protein
MRQSFHAIGDWVRLQAFGSTLAKWRFQKLRHTTLTSKVVEYSIALDRGELARRYL